MGRLQAFIIRVPTQVLATFMERLPDLSVSVVFGLASTKSGTTSANTGMTGMTGIIVRTIGTGIGAAGKATVT
jgi:hypothetical protein